MSLTLSRKLLLVIALILFGSGLFAFNLFWPASKNRDYRYPYPIAATQSSELENDIALYLKRFAGDPKGAFDPATLAELYVVQGKIAGNLDSFDKAEKYARISIKNRATSNPGPTLVLADVAQAKHQFARAIQIANDLLKERPGAAEILPILVTAYLAIGDLSNASRVANELADDSPGSNSSALRALVEEAQGRDAEAIFDYTQSLKLEEADNFRESAWTRFLFARFYIDRGQFKDARLLLTEALRILPNDPLSLGLMAKLAEDQEDNLRAENYYHKAFVSSKQIPFLLGEARIMMFRNPVEANEMRNQGEILARAELNNRGYGHRSELIRLLLERAEPGDAKEAVELAREEIKGRPNSESYHLLAWAYLLSGDIPSARNAIRSALVSGVKKPEIYFHAGEIEKAARDLPAAELYFQLARDLNPYLRDPTPKVSGWRKWLAVR